MKVCFGHKHFGMILHLNLFSCSTIVIAAFHIIIVGYTKSVGTAA